MLKVKLEDNVREYANKQVTIKNFGNRSVGFNGNKEKPIHGHPGRVCGTSSVG